MKSRHLIAALSQRLTLVVLLALTPSVPLAAAGEAPTVLVGAAKIDITPDLPIRLSGYGSRATETNEVETRLFARALAIGSDRQKPAVLIALEVVGVSEEFSDAVAAALNASHRIERARLAICTTHTHAGPSLKGVLPFMFSKELPADEAARIDAYTAKLQAMAVEVARAALADRKPGRVAWAQGSANFASQRRKVENGKWTGFGVVAGGSVDHALPVLRVTDERGAVRALFASYACHCTTLQGSDNVVHSDWAGDAATRIENAHAGSVVLVAIGCGADANPGVRGRAAVPVHGAKIATEVERLLAGPMQPLGIVTDAKYRRIELPFDHSVTREEMEKRMAPAAKQTGTYAASKFLQQLEAGRLPGAVPYPIQAWRFGDNLAMVFLAGEVVSEYSLRLRRELDGSRLWVNAYANSVPCYIPSKRMFAEGGYEVDGSMNYYGWPARLAIGTEDRIIGVVRELVPAAFEAAR